MKKLVLILMSVFTLYGVEFSIDSNLSSEAESLTSGKAYFGEQLFQGNFKENTQYRYNPNYLINVGDVISLKIWGAYSFEGDIPVDKQGNIFIPQVGVVHLLGIPNKNIKEKISEVISKTFSDNIYVYADVKQYQPISVFVTGAVKKVGLYEGLSTDSVLQFLDKAGGIIRGQGSYRNITILRNRRPVKSIDLYSFLLNGGVDLFQFRNGDVILVNPVKYFVEVDGEVNRPYIFELRGNRSTVKDIMKYILPKTTTNSFMITSWKGMNEDTREYPISMASRVRVKNGMKVSFFSSHYADRVHVVIEGEHKGLHDITVEKGESLYGVLKKINYTPLSDIKNIRLYRKSVADTQKQLIDSMLKDLTRKVFTASPSTPDEAKIRTEEANLVMKFVEEAKKAQPKGQVVLGFRDNLSKIRMEDGDRIYIPKKSNVVVVQGQVSIPGAQTYKEYYSVDRYIETSGGYTDRADRDHVLVIRANGKAISHKSGSDDVRIEPGDSILVLGEVGTKNLMLAKDIMQIIYQIAISTAAILSI
jgi:protein involved in polysaccharide export with SLBB domain